MSCGNTKNGKKIGRYFDLCHLTRFEGHTSMVVTINVITSLYDLLFIRSREQRALHSRSDNSFMEINSGQALFHIYRSQCATALTKHRLDMSHNTRVLWRIKE